MSGTRKSIEIDRINKLYDDHSAACDANVIAFEPPHNLTVLGLLDDVEALLMDPKTRKDAEAVLRTALQHISQQQIF